MSFLCGLIAGLCLIAGLSYRPIRNALRERAIKRFEDALVSAIGTYRVRRTLLYDFVGQDKHYVRDYLDIGTLTGPYLALRLSALEARIDKLQFAAKETKETP